MINHIEKEIIIFQNTENISVTKKSKLKTFNENLLALKTSYMFENGSKDITKEILFNNYSKEILFIKNIVCENSRIFVIKFPLVNIFGELFTVKEMKLSKLTNLIKNNKGTYYFYNILIDDNNELKVRGFVYLT